MEWYGDEVYEDLCLAGLQQNSEYHNRLLDTEDQQLVERVQGQYKFGFGLN